MTKMTELEGPGRFITRPNSGEAVVGFGGFPSGFWFALVWPVYCGLLLLLALVLPFWNRNFYSVLFYIGSV